MDTQRYALLIALALVSWMMLVEWNVFREAHREAAETAAESVVQVQTPSVPASASDAPAPTPDAPLPAGELPSLSTPTNAAAASTNPAPEAQAEVDERVRIGTDSLIVEISLEGGDIAAVSLPRFLAEIDRPDRPFRLLEQANERSYTAQSGLIGPNGTDTTAGRPRFTSPTRSLSMDENSRELVVDLNHSTPEGVQVTKRFRFERGSYVVGVEYLIENRSSAPWQAAMFGQLRRDNRPDPSATGGALGVQPFLGFATRTIEEPYIKRRIDDLADEPYDAQTSGGWVALVQHYFISAWIPTPEHQNRFELLRSETGYNLGRFTSPSVSLAPGQSGTLSARFYAGPKDQYALKKISAGLDLTVDYGWLWWIAQPLFALLSFFATGRLHIFGWETELGSGTGNWGAAIILLTLFVKACFFQLSATSYKSMAKMRVLQPKMLELRERYGDDRQKLSQETMDLYRREKVNPLGGCLPILIQMPVFLALYWVLLESVELRQAPFLAWIDDLSVMDPYFVLPILMGASMYYQQTLNPPPPDPMQAKIFQFMPIIFTVFFLFFPAGLVLYWLVNNVLSIAQQWIITRQIERGA